MSSGCLDGRRLRVVSYPSSGAWLGDRAREGATLLAVLFVTVLVLGAALFAATLLAVLLATLRVLLLLLARVLEAHGFSSL